MGSERQRYFFDLPCSGSLWRALYQCSLFFDSPHTSCLCFTSLPAYLFLSLSFSLSLVKAPVTSGPPPLLPLCEAITGSTPPSLPSHVLPLEDMHLGSCCTLLCVLINILAASGRKWVFLWANPLWGGCLEQRKGKMIEEEGQALLFLFSMSDVVKTSDTKQMPWKCEYCVSPELC